MSKSTPHITEETISMITTSLAQVSPLFNGLIPSFTTRQIDRLGGCLGCACEKEDPVARISTVYYMINRERPFKNGNKRIALALFLYLLAKEGKWLKATDDELFDFAHWVGIAPPDAEEEVVAYIEKFIKRHVVTSHQDTRSQEDRTQKTENRGQKDQKKEEKE